MLTEQEKFMKEAIRQAKKARALEEVPIGCVIVYEGKIIARGYNRRNTDPFQNPGSLFEKTQNFFLRNLRLLGRMQHQRTVLAERTAEIAASQKDRSGYPSWIIQ